jgi:hypothetical protein
MTGHVACMGEKTDATLQSINLKERDPLDG